MSDSREMVRLAIEALEEKKAIDLRVIDIRQVSVIADYFIIASGSNVSQVQALADSATEALERNGHSPRQIEGYGSASWILMDYGDIIIHVFSEESRVFYDLERIWRDGADVDTESFK